MGLGRVLLAPRSESDLAKIANHLANDDHSEMTVSLGHYPAFVRLDINHPNRVKAKRMYSPMKTSLAGPNAMGRIRVFLIATCLLAFTPHLVGDIILVSRLSDVDTYAFNGHYWPSDPPPQSQSGFFPANLCDEAFSNGGLGYGGGTANSTSNSSILINNGMEGLRVVGDGTAIVDVNRAVARASAKIIVLSFTLTEVSYPYSITGQLHGLGDFGGVTCDDQSHPCRLATAKLTSDTGTIFEKAGTTLSESGILPPGNYTLSVNAYASTPNFSSVGNYQSDANFTFTLNGPMSTPTPTPTPIPATHATNLSTRLLIDTGNYVGIGGFIITGRGPRHVLIRGIGPSLSGIIANTLPDPSLQVYRSRCYQNLTNNNWRDTQEAEIIATGRAPGNDLESAIVADLTPGFYTAILSGTANTTGVGLVEIYDVSRDQDSRMANISTRGNVQTGDDILIAGFILGGGSGEDSVIVRGLGPSLFLGFPPTNLSDPRLELRDSNGQLIIENDNWMDDPNQAAIIQAAGLAPSNGLESAIAATLMPGEYTALLSGVNNGTGVGLVEVYDNLAIGPTPMP